ncbi:MAG: IS66 family insertion sequence element accessory protein TnpB [Pseudohongiella sp.]|nr:IS66 family insertion sequence element accessory protein TnpB [Pseudohongiella sp.]
MSEQDNQQYWQQQISQCQAKGLSGAAYCKLHKISYHKFVYWRAKLRDADLPSPAVGGFVKVIATQRSSAKLTVLLPGGISITGFDAGNIALLGAVLRQLR